MCVQSEHSHLVLAVGSFSHTAVSPDTPFTFICKPSPPVLCVRNRFKKPLCICLRTCHARVKSDSCNPPPFSVAFSLSYVRYLPSRETRVAILSVLSAVDADELASEDSFLESLPIARTPLVTLFIPTMPHPSVRPACPLCRGVGGGLKTIRRRHCLVSKTPFPGTDETIPRFLGFGVYGSKHSETPPADGLTTRSRQPTSSPQRPRNVPSAIESEIPKTIAQDSCAQLRRTAGPNW